MKIKFISFIIIIIFITVILPGSVFASTLSLTPSVGTFNKSCSFTLKIDLDTGGAQTEGTDAILLYDPSRLSATQILNGSIYSDYPGSNIDSRNGKITVSGLSSATSPYSGKGTLATINFTVLDNAQAGATQINFDFDPQDRAKTTDSNVVDTSVADTLTSVTNGSYTVGSGSCISVSPTPGPYGGPYATPSANPYGPGTTKGSLPNAGTEELTATIAIVGGILTILGVLGLAIL